MKGDEILLACVGGKIGKVALVDQNQRGHNIVRATARIRVSARVNRVFLAYLLRTDFAKRYYVRVTRAVGQPTLNIKQINELPVITPPMSDQIEFAKRVEKAEIIRNELEKSLQRLKNLIGQLSNQVFNVKLDLSRINVHNPNPDFRDENTTAIPINDS